MKNSNRVLCVLVCVGTILIGSSSLANNLSRSEKARIACAIAGNYGAVVNRFEKDKEVLQNLELEMDHLMELFNSSKAGRDLAEKKSHYRYYFVVHPVELELLKKIKRDARQVEFEKGLSESIARLNDLKAMEDLLKSVMLIGMQSNYRAKTGLEKGIDSGIALKSAINYHNVVDKFEKMLRNRMKEDFQKDPKFYSENGEVYNQYTKLLNIVLELKKRLSKNIYESMGSLENSSTTPISIDEFRSILYTMSLRSAEEFTNYIDRISQNQKNIFDRFLLIDSVRSKIYKLYSRFEKGDSLEDYSDLVSEYQPIKNWDAGLDGLRLKILEELGSESPDFYLDSKSPFLAKTISLESARRFIDNIVSSREKLFTVAKELSLGEKYLNQIYANILMGLSRNQKIIEVFREAEVSKRLGELPDDVIFLMQKEVEKFNSGN
ncbi:MAG: hypothetical protein VX642_10725 [Bdellovibrionota bacterium]|nr:hypothetical protein [Bdellovibrionota bacterium]